MIIDKNKKSYITNSMFPNSNWTKNKNVYVVEDGSELANKIKEHSPFYEFVEEDGELVDIEPMEIPEKEEKEGYEANLIKDEDGNPKWEYVKKEKSLREENQELKQLLGDLTEIVLEEG